MNLLLAIHRNLGIAVGWMVLAWCLSGVVMLFVEYPSVSSDEALSVLPELDMTDCCRLPALDERSGWQSADIEMLDRKPVLRVRHVDGQFSLYDLRRGQPLSIVEPIFATRYIEGLKLPATTEFITRHNVTRDQWTVAGEFDVHRPLQRIEFVDEARTTWYLSSATGQLVQSTTRPERFWNYLGAVVHWIYPTELRRHKTTWTLVVIGLSLAGTFLVLTGLLVGVRRLLDREPYSGWNLLHHFSGLVFGLFLLAWLVSGLLSMNPAGMLEGRSFSAEQNAIAGRDLSGRLVAGSISDLPLLPTDGYVRLSASLFAGEFAWIGWRSNGESRRLSGSPRLDPAQIEAHAPGIRRGVEISDAGMLADEDAYFYGAERQRQLPVYRILYHDGERLYLDSTSGELLLGVDAGRRGYRWWFSALHTGDFGAWSRGRPLWDIVMLVLLIGVTAGSLSGAYLAWRRFTA